MLSSFGIADVTRSPTKVLTLSMTGLTNGIRVEDIQGLGPVPAQVSMADFSFADGARYQSARRSGRNIVLKLGLEPGLLTAAAMRRQLYSFLAPKAYREIRLTHVDYGIIVVKGWIESNEPDIFTKDPIQVISILTEEPDFVTQGTTQISQLSTTSSQPASLSTPSSSNAVFTYEGTAGSGIEVDLVASAAINTLDLYAFRDNAVSQRMALTDLNMVTGDRLIITTDNGSKNIRRLKTNNANQPALDSLVVSLSKWIELLDGQYNFYIRQPAGTVTQHAYILRFQTRYVSI